jgi:hypothetical protein
MSWRIWFREYGFPLFSLITFSLCMGYVIFCLSVVGR